MRKKQTEEVKLNPQLLNVITPIGLEFRLNDLFIGENKAKIYGIVKYPQQPAYGWLSKLMNIPNTVASITFMPINNGEFIQKLSKSITQKKVEYSETKSELSASRAETSFKDAERMMVELDRDGETAGTIMMAIMPLAPNEKELEEICETVGRTASAAKCKERVIARLQQQSFKCVSPYYTVDSDVDQVLKRPIPMSAFMGGFPFSATGHNDGTGYYLAKDTSGGLIVINPWLRGEDRINTNFAIFGPSGVGKSTTVKSIIESEYMIGTKIIIIDAEREYRDLCKNLNGDWINAGGGKKGKINPLQIRPVPKDEEDEELDDSIGDLARYLKHLDVFFALYKPTLTERRMSILKKIVIELYQRFNITWDTDITQLSNTDFPIFEDLHKMIVDKKEQAKKEGTTLYADYEELALQFEDIAYGGDSFLWNGQTSVETHSRCICLDTYALNESSDQIKQTQYFNLLTYAWQQMSNDRNERILLIADEAYLMVDPNVPQSLIFLRNAVKRARKYEAGIAVISQSLVDFLAPSVKQYGQALLDNPCYKILMGSDGQDLEEMKQLYKLTDAEEALLAQRRKRHGLFMIGAKRMHVEFDLPDYKLELMGSGGGR